MSEILLQSFLFIFVSLPVALVPLFLGMPGKALCSAVCFALIAAIAIIEAKRYWNAPRVRWGLLGFAGAVAIVLCLLGGEGHVFYANTDWLYRDAVLRDLAQQSWPVTYHFDGQDWLLRAPLGMYMLPALAGKLCGPGYAGIALLVQNVTVFSLVFYFIVPSGSSKRTAIIVIGVFCIFSGWDIAGAGLKYFFTGKLPPDSHIEWWAGSFQYSAHITQLFWVPNHAASGWVLACLYLRWTRGELSIGLLLASVPLLAFWSPLAALGMLPFAAYAALNSLVFGKLTIIDIFMATAATAAALPMVFYERLDAGTVPHGFLWDTPIFFFIYPLFITLEVLPFVVLILWARREAIGATFLITAAVLLTIPVYRLGYANDFAMRASIPALAILAVIFGIACATARGRPVWTSAAVATLVIGSVTGLLEISAPLTHERNVAAGCNLVQTWRSHDPDKPFGHYIVPIDPIPNWAVRHPAIGIPTQATSACPSPQS